MTSTTGSGTTQSGTTQSPQTTIPKCPFLATLHHLVQAGASALKCAATIEQALAGSTTTILNLIGVHMDALKQQGIDQNDTQLKDDAGFMLDKVNAEKSNRGL